MSTESVMLSSHLILYHPLLLLPSISPESLTFLMVHSKYWSYSFRLSPSKDYPGLSSFRIDWFDLFAVQGILKSLLQHHISKASILWCLVFFLVQLSHLYMTTGKHPQLPLTSLMIWKNCFFLCCFPVLEIRG